MGYPKTDLFLKNNLNCYNKNCQIGEYLCYKNAYCIDIGLMCDNISHCPLGDDEYDCGKKNKKNQRM